MIYVLCTSASVIIAQSVETILMFMDHIRHNRSKPKQHNDIHKENFNVEHTPNGSDANKEDHNQRNKQHHDNNEVPVQVATDSDGHLEHGEDYVENYEDVNSTHDHQDFNNEQQHIRHKMQFPTKSITY